MGTGGSSLPFKPATTSQATQTVQTKYVFKRSLTIGASGEDVRQLQIFLNKNNFVVARAGVGSPGKESTFFGPATRLALIRYQIAKKITPAAGFFGPTTRTRVMSGK
jgi:peptidoglycan hydrolase-like protein with peptidoglycan-binding domain